MRRSGDDIPRNVVRDAEGQTCRVIETGGIEFLVAGAEAIGKDRAKTPRMVKAAALNYAGAAPVFATG